ncbi:MAG: DUF4236 domain-containing protein [Bacteroidota bacterium]
MGFRFQKRINLGDGVGINVSKSGLSTSVRTKYGSFGSRGFSLRTGIPGLSWRSGFGGKNGGAVLLLILLVLGAFIIAYNLLRFAVFLIGWIWTSIFTEEGVNYKFLIGFIVVVSGMTAALYFYTPTSVSAPPPPPPIVEDLPILTDTLATEPKPQKPKRKKKEKAKLDTTAIHTEPKIQEYPEEMESREPAINPDSNATSGGVKNIEPIDTNTTVNKSQDLSSPEITPDDAGKEGKKSKWYQFRKRRAEKKQEQQDSDTENSSQ